MGKPQKRKKTTKQYKTNNDCQTVLAQNQTKNIMGKISKTKQQNNIVKLLWLRTNKQKKHVGEKYNKKNKYVKTTLAQGAHGQTNLKTFFLLFLFVFPHVFFLFFRMFPSFVVLAGISLTPGLEVNGGLPSGRFNATAS